MNTFNWLTTTLIELSPLARGLLIAWVLEMLSIPILERVEGDGAQRRGVVLGVIFQAATVIAVLIPTWGVSRTLVVALGVVVLAWVAEFVGTCTGLPFGRYHYTDRLQPQLSHVPLIIPLAWLMMLPPAWAVADAITDGQRGLGFIIMSGLAFTAWDLFLDPQMVKWGLWKWDQPGGYFGIPWLNFFGWCLTASLVTAAVNLPALPAAPLLVVYGITWLLEVSGQLLFWRLPGPAAAGFVGMGIFVIMALLR
jgi:uncharacterized membrane protein